MDNIGRFGVHCREAKKCKINILNNSIVLKNNTKAMAIALTQNDHKATTANVTGNMLTIGQQGLIGGQMNTIAYGGIAVFEQGISYPLIIKNNNIVYDMQLKMQELKFQTIIFHLQD